MKYVKKYQSGGGLVAYTPNPLSSPSTPVAPQSGAAGSLEETKKSFKPDKLFDTIVKSKGLTNETDKLMDELQHIQHMFSYSDEQGWPYYMEIAKKLNGLRRNEEMWSSAYSTAKESQGLNEVAVGTQGELYTLNKQGKLQTMSAKQYNQTKGVQLLTVADLLNQRDKNPDLINNNSIFDVANSSVGMEKITSHIQDFVKMIGKDKSKDENFVSKTQSAAEIARTLGTSPPSKEELKGLEILYKVINAPTETTKVTQEMETQKRDMGRAARYIWQNLDTSAQNKLRAQAELNGTNPSQMLLDIIDGSTSHSEATTLTSIADPKEKAGSGSGSGSIAGAKPMTPLQTLLHGTYALEDSRLVFNNPDENAMFSGMLFGSMPLTTVNNEFMGPTDLYSMMKQGGWEQVGKMQEIYFGNKKVGGTELQEIVTDGRTEIAHAILPVKADGSPDNEALEEFNATMEAYRANKDSMTPYQIKNLFSNNGFNVDINEDGSVNVASKTGTQTRPFLLTWGYTTGGSDLITDNNKEEEGGARKLSKADNKKFFDIVEPAWNEDIKKKGKKATISHRPRGFLTGKTLYKAPIYIALQDAYVPRGDQAVGKGPQEMPYFAETVMSRQQNSGVGSQGFNSSSINDAN